MIQTDIPGLDRSVLHLFVEDFLVLSQHLHPSRLKLGVCIDLTELRCTSGFGEAAPIGYPRCHPFFICIFYDETTLFRLSPAAPLSLRALL